MAKNERTFNTAGMVRVGSRRTDAEAGDEDAERVLVDAVRRDGSHGEGWKWTEVGEG